MRLFEGLPTTDYQDLLRALGRVLDAAGSRDLRLVETDTGLTIQARRLTDLASGFGTQHYADHELLELLQSAYARRGSGGLASPTDQPLGVRYQDALRAVGMLVDQAGLRNLRVVEQPGMLLVQGTAGGVLRRGYRTHQLTEKQLLAAVSAARRGERGDLGPLLS
jgi:hypothetical protein